MIDVEYTTKSDAEVVALALQSQYHFGEIVERYEAKLLRYIMRSSNVTRDDAEDILQDTFVKAYYNLNGFNTSLKFSSWIYRIAHNEVISSYRKKKVRPQGNSAHVENEVIQAIADEFDLASVTDQTLLKEFISEALDKLDIKYREVIVLKFLQEKSYDEIAAILKKPPGTVATLISRAKKQLQKIISNSSTKQL